MNFVNVQVCTFGDNRPQILRCSVCDAVRGTTLDYFMGHNAEVSSASASQQDAQDSAAKAGSRKRPGLDAAGNKQKSILGFFAGFEPPAKAAESSALAGSGNTEALAGEQRASNSVQTPQQACSGQFSCHPLSQSVCSSMYADRLQQDPSSRR